MRRLLLAFSLTGLSFAAGCSMCDNPYDYCGPVVDSGYHEGYISEGTPTEGKPTESDQPYYEEGEQSTMRAPRRSMSVASRPGTPSVMKQHAPLQSVQKRPVR